MYPLLGNYTSPCDYLSRWAVVGRYKVWLLFSIAVVKIYEFGHLENSIK